MTRAAETFLGGRVTARQPESGYRAAMDTVLLGAAVTVRPGERALELGCGSAAALLIAAERNGEAEFAGLERAPDALSLARENVASNGCHDRITVTEGDVATLPTALCDAFDHVFFNPPFFEDETALRPPKDPARRAAFLTGDAGLPVWIAAALRSLRGRGRLTLIHRAERLGDILAAIEGRAGGAQVLPVHPRADAPARRVLVRARKGVRSPLTLLPPFVLHREDGVWTPEALAVQEGRAGLPFPS